MILSGLQAILLPFLMKLQWNFAGETAIKYYIYYIAKLCPNNAINSSKNFAPKTCIIVSYYIYIIMYSPKNLCCFPLIKTIWVELGGVSGFVIRKLLRIQGGALELAKLTDELCGARGINTTTFCWGRAVSWGVNFEDGGKAACF